jgi:hypothetical protein
MPSYQEENAKVVYWNISTYLLAIYAILYDQIRYFHMTTGTTLPTKTHPHPRPHHHPQH